MFDGDVLIMPLMSHKEIFWKCLKEDNFLRLLISIQLNPFITEAVNGLVSI